MKKLLFILGLWLAGGTLLAQEKPEEKKKIINRGDNDLKLSVLPYYNFGRGWG
ncbi:MAG: hypothetical protein LRY55_00160 [Leadbetterella sp.]|nr:hypothetical protein [Leadbetterella sp.]